MSFAHIKNEIVDKLETVTNITEVHAYPTNDFNGYPACNVVTINNESDYQSNQENERHYVYLVQLVQDTETVSVLKARKIIESLVDEVMDLFDSDEFLTGISMPTKKTMIGLIPALSEIIEGDKYVIAHIMLTAKVLFDIN